jgi:hypothetical protein
MLNLRRRLVSLERHTLASSASSFEWSEIGEIPEEMLRSLTMETLQSLAGAIQAQDQGRRLSVPEMKAATDLFRLRYGGSRPARSGWRETKQSRPAQNAT